MGLNAYLAYTVVLGMGYSWQQALAAIFVEGLFFIILSLTKVRESIFNSIPMNLKHAVSVGIGLFITFIGLQNVGIIQANQYTHTQFVDIHGALNSEAGLVSVAPALLALLGFSDNYELCLCVGFGYPDETPDAKPRDKQKYRFVD